jgi:acyl dehydratase
MEISPFSVPREERYFEDYVPGHTHECGSVTFAEDEIVTFAHNYDPQAMHIDAEKASRSPLGGVIASGWHTVSAVMRLYVDHFVSGVANTPSPGVDELRWHRPVRPGDTLDVRVTVNEVRLSRSKPDRGIVKSYVEAFDRDGQLVLSLRTNDIVLRRPISRNRGG